MNPGVHPCVAVGKKHHDCGAPGGAAPVVLAARGFGSARPVLHSRSNKQKSPFWPQNPGRVNYWGF